MQHSQPSWPIKLVSPLEKEVRQVITVAYMSARCGDLLVCVKAPLSI